MWFWIIVICIVVIAVYSANQASNFAESVAILGMRMPKNWDSYEKKGSEQFKDECHKHSISTDAYNMANVCTYLRILERKGLHLELIKDSTVRYRPKEGKYLGTEEWQDKWTRIVFSPHISGKAFCECIRTIMAAHNFSESENNVQPYVKGLDGMIKEKDSFFIYRALYIMRYNILIKENDSSLKDYEVNSPNILIERGKPTTIFSYPKDETCVVKTIAQSTTIEKGFEIRENYITSEGNYPKIIYIENILSKDSGLKSKSGLKVTDGNIILALKSPFDIRLMKEEAVIAENIIKIEITDNSISGEYLYLFLKLLCHRFIKNGVNDIKVEDLRAIDIVVAPSHIQREIIKKGMSVKNNAEQLEAVFSSYYETYPSFRLVLNKF